MRLGPLHIGRQPAVTAAAAPAKLPPREKGASGTINLGGLLDQAEYNQALRGAEALKTFDRMIRSDGSVQEALAHITAPILNASWDIEPASDLPEDAEVCEATRRAYFEWLAPKHTWAQHLDEALDYLVFGHYLFEIVWQVVDDVELEIDDPSGALEPDPKDPTGQKQRKKRLTLPKRQYLTFRRFDPRLPYTVFKWNDRDGELHSITQQVYKDGGYEEVEILAEQLLVFTNRRRGSDYTGRSLLRAAYKPWVFKELIEKVAGIAVERHGVGVPIAYPPASAANDEAIIGRLENIMRDLRAGAFSYIVAPGPKGQSSVAGQDGYLFEIMSPSGGIPDFTNLLEYHRGEIKGSVLARFAELGHGSTGARSTGDTQSEVWRDALHAVARYVEDVHSEAIRAFVRANYPGTLRWPKLVVGDIESKNLAEFAAANAQLVAAGAIRVDQSYRAHVRQVMDAPDEDNPAAEDEEEQVSDDDVGRARPDDELARRREQDTAAAARLEGVEDELRQARGRIEELEGREQPAPHIEVNVPAQPPAQVTIAEGAIKTDVHVAAPPPAQLTIEEGAIQVAAAEAPPPANVNVTIEKGTGKKTVTFSDGGTATVEDE